MRNNRRLVLVFSVMLNVFLLPLNYLSLKVDNARYEIYEYLASKTEVNPEIIFTGDSITRNGGIWAFRINRYNLRTINIAKGGFDTDGVKYITLRAMRSNLCKEFTTDGCHVNENAYDIWAGMITSNPTYNSLFN